MLKLVKLSDACIFVVFANGEVLSVACILYIFRMTPQASRTKSPEDSRPSQSLDLSDTDSEIVFKVSGVIRSMLVTV